jgi:DNA-binding CsgD family transcriptional regulator
MSTAAASNQRPLPAPDSDFYQLVDVLTADERALVKRVRHYMESKVQPIINKYWADDAFPFELLPSFRELKLGVSGFRGTIQSLESLGCGREAGAMLDLVVAAAVEGGMARVLLDEGWATDSLIARAPSTGDARMTTLLRLMEEPTAAADATGRGRTTPAFRLTSRETQILRLVWKGSSNKAIARDLFLTENTVETHLRRIFAKLGTRNRAQAATLAREAGAI